MRIAFLFLIALLVCITYAQSWSVPVNISNMPGNDTYSDYCIDSNGAIHVVWEHEFQPDAVNKIMYSKSIDNGQTWSTPVAISEDIDDLMGSPLIVADSQNNLHVTYYYHNWENNQLHYRKCTNQVWGPFVDVLPGISYVINRELVIDNNDKLYVFFTLFDDWTKIKYRYLENGIWSDIIIPFNQSTAFYNILRAVVDDENNLLCMGEYSDGVQLGVLSYFKFYAATNTWREPMLLGTSQCAWGYDIALDTNDNPHLVWREFISSIPPYEMTKYSFYNGLCWTLPNVITEYGRSQTLVIDGNNSKHMVESKKFVVNEYVSNWKLKYYIGDDWENGEVLTNNSYIATYPKLIYKNNVLYLLYLDRSTASASSEVYLMKKQLSTDLFDPENNNQHPILLFQNCPNPFNNQTQIRFFLKEGGITKLSVFNLKGQLIKTMLSEYKKAGDYSFTWNGMDESNRAVSSGIYIYRLQVGNKFTSRMLALVR